MLRDVDDEDATGGKDGEAWEDWPSVKEDTLSTDLCCFGNSNDIGCGCEEAVGANGLKSGCYVLRS